LPEPDDAPFDTIAIVGLGLIGGSLALAIRERWSACRIIGIDRQPVQAHALGSGAIDRGVDTIAAAGPVDLIVLAAPVRQNVRLLAEAAAHASPHTLITDVGGTKQDIVLAARSLPNPRAFVGGHPIGGAAHGGFGFARPDLFKSRPWIFTPDEVTPESAVAIMSKLVSGLGARPVVIDAARHDRLMAFVSHLPQLAASALMAASGEGAQADGLRMAGRGLLDTTRLASSPADVWRDICGVNADAIGDALDALIEKLTAMRNGLRDGEAIESVFNEAAKWRVELTRTQ
jgi:prephenate dehydrogenase